jgi:hypothetical protein
LKRILAVVLILCAANVTLASDIGFENVKLVDARGNQMDASLTFSESAKAMVVRVANRDATSIPYDKIDKLSYEYSTKHRTAQGGAVMVASLGAGAVVMLTKSKSHWLYVAYHQDNGASTLVLRMDKKNYKKIIETANAQTGKQVEDRSNGKNSKQG